MRRAVGEAVSVVANALGWGADVAEERTYAPRRGPAHVVVQVVAVAAVVALGVVVRLALGSEPGAPIGWAIAGFLMLLPFALQWFAGPPRRTVGLVIGLVVTGGLLFAAWPVLAPMPFWPGFGLVVVAFAAGGATFGAIAPVPRR